MHEISIGRLTEFVHRSQVNQSSISSRHPHLRLIVGLDVCILEHRFDLDRSDLLQLHVVMVLELFIEDFVRVVNSEFDICFAVL